MYWLDQFGEGFAMYFCGEIVDFFDTIEEAQAAVDQLRA
jgi:hypothetical protein